MRTKMNDYIKMNREMLLLEKSLKKDIIEAFKGQLSSDLLSYDWNYIGEFEKEDIIKDNEDSSILSIDTENGLLEVFYDEGKYSNDLMTVYFEFNFNRTEMDVVLIIK